MSEKFERSTEDKKRCVEMYDKCREDLLKRQLSNNENYDKAILSLSSAALALSLTAIKFIIPIETAEYIFLLKLSWFFFLMTIICSLAAYLISNHAISKQLDITRDYYIEGFVDAQFKKNIFATVNNVANHITGILFIVALSLVITFITFNINGDRNMSKEKTTTVPIKKSVIITTVKKAPGERGFATASADIPTMELAPGTKKPAPKDTK
jgi:hypothetical protein